MTESVDPNDYPLPLAALKFLCRPAAWLAWRRAEEAWHYAAAASGVRADVRAAAASRYYRIRYLIPDDPCEWWIDVEGKGQVRAHLDPICRAALDELAVQRIAMKKSSLDRIRRGEIKVLKRRQSDDTSRWSELEPDRINERDFFRDATRILFNCRDLKNQMWLEAWLRDAVGVPPDQAVYVYGDVHAIGRLQQIERGESSAKTSSAVADVAEKAEASYRLEFHSIAAALLNQLRTGELVGVHAGQILLRRYWSELDVSAPIESWYPCVLIRTPTLGKAANIHDVVSAMAQMSNETIQRAGEPRSRTVIKENVHAARRSSFMLKNSIARLTEGLGTSNDLAAAARP